MELGIGLWGMQAARGAPRHHASLYEEMIEDCQLAEELGFHSFWLTEHHFWYDGYCPSLLVAVGALAAATRRIKLATGMVLAPMHEPLRLAEQAAMADILSHGRLILGLANGYRDAEFDGFGLRRRDRGARLTEMFEILKRAWSGSERLSFSGQHFTYDGVAVAPRPIQKPHPPIVVGSSPLFEPAVRRAAKFGVGLLLPPIGGPEQFRRALDIWSDTAARAGHDVTKLRSTEQARMGVACDVWVDETTERAERVLPNLRYLYKEQLGGWRFLVDEEGKPVAFDRPEILDAAVAGAEAVAVVGNPDKVIRGLKRFEQAGVDLFCARVRWDSLPRQELHRCMRLLAREVMPALSSRPL